MLRFKEVAEKVAENAGIKVAETSKKVTENRTEKVTVNAGAKVTVNRTENEPPTENHQGLIEKLIERASLNGDKLSKNRIDILILLIDNPYITKRELAEAIGIREISIWRNIEAMRGKYLRRVGSNKSGFGEMIIDDRTEKVTTNRTEPNRKTMIGTSSNPIDHFDIGRAQITNLSAACFPGTIMYSILLAEAICCAYSFLA